MDLERFVVYFNIILLKNVHCLPMNDRYSAAWCLIASGLGAYIFRRENF